MDTATRVIVGLIGVAAVVATVAVFPDPVGGVYHHSLTGVRCSDVEDSKIREYASLSDPAQRAIREAVRTDGTATVEPKPPEFEYDDTLGDNRYHVRYEGDCYRLLTQDLVGDGLFGIGATPVVAIALSLVLVLVPLVDYGLGR